MNSQYIAVFDFGTSSVKGLLINRTASIVLPHQISIHTTSSGNRSEQDSGEWFASFHTIVRRWISHGVEPKQIVAITFSGQMQDLICLDHDGCPSRPAILYADARAEREAHALVALAPDLPDRTGNPFNGTTPFAKWFWLKNNQPELESKTDFLLFSPKDFLIWKLTGRRVIDPTNASTTGMMALDTAGWMSDLLDEPGLSVRKLPQIVSFDRPVGPLNADAAKLTGLKEGTPVFCGCGDAAATSLGAGCLSDGDTYIYLGTTGWVAAPAKQRRQTMDGLFYLRYTDEWPYLAIAPLLNVGSAHRWAARLLADDDFHRFEAMARTSRPGSGGTLFLPYLNGARCPVGDSSARGAFIGIGSATKTDDLARAVLEGVAFSLRQVAELLASGKINPSMHEPGQPAAGHHQMSQSAVKPNQMNPSLLENGQAGQPADKKPIRLIGGGAESEVWCHIIADIFQREIAVPANARYLPALGAASGTFVRLGWQPSLTSYAEMIFRHSRNLVYTPEKSLKETYNRLYARFTRIYPAIRSI